MGKKILGLWALLLLAVLVPLSVAQDSTPRDGGNPFEEEFDYLVGDQLALGVSIQGLVWRRFSISAGDPAEFVVGKETRTEIVLEADNPTNETLVLNIILLLEDERGNRLQRIELKAFKVKGGRLKEDVQKVRIDGGVLAETGKVYFFAEVS